MAGRGLRVFWVPSNATYTDLREWERAGIPNFTMHETRRQRLLRYLSWVVAVAVVVGTLVILLTV